MTVHSGRWSLEDRLERGLRELPFEVPPGTASLTVELAFDGGVIDLGCHGPDGFRGWSGGARRRYTVTPDWATPGYLPGELEPGLWHVWLGLHRVPPGGVPYEVAVTTSPVPLPKPEAETLAPRPERPPARDLPAPAGWRWLAGDLHAHTVHSDGTLTVDELAGRAAARGLDFLAVTDHNTVSHHPELPAAGAHAGVVLVLGQEVTTDLGHANVFGDTGWVDFRRPSADWARRAADRGGVMSINHPLSGDCAWRRPLPEADRPPLVEIWHSSWWDRTWGAPLAWTDLWLPGGAVPVGGSDFHDPAQHKILGEPTTWVLAEDASADGVVAALRSGRTSVSSGPRAPVLLRVEDDLVALDADGTVLVGPGGRRVAIRGDHVAVPAKDPGMHRLETHTNEVIALCG
ncbi:CehA/McbA family metallohydrolase [Actinomadura litoris]|uniref:CehA/McbA family metallohydrolase n=1 Tax=Actinomadura litoris TaxID=2678616 RepID=UPI001FA6F26D|nr:CehA/McbA family metallohydrolase [Actinomadura litoris]